MRAHALPQIIGLIAFSLAAPLSSAVAQTETSRMERTVTVSATGFAAATPDVAHITTGVATEADTARAALTRNSEAMKGLLAGVKALGIDAKDLQTSSLRVEPRYTNPRDGTAPVIDGYRVTNDVAVTVRDLEKLGQILDQLVTLGANQMSGLSFEVSNAETLKDDARKEAIANALRRAKLYAAAAGVAVGDVLTIAEDVQFVAPRPMASARTATAKAVPIEQGTEMLEARVTVTWSLK